MAKAGLHLGEMRGETEKQAALMVTVTPEGLLPAPRSPPPPPPAPDNGGPNPRLPAVDSQYRRCLDFMMSKTRGPAPESRSSGDQPGPAGEARLASSVAPGITRRTIIAASVAGAATLLARPAKASTNPIGARLALPHPSGHRHRAPGQRRSRAILHRPRGAQFQPERRRARHPGATLQGLRADQAAGRASPHLPLRADRWAAPADRGDHTRLPLCRQHRVEGAPGEQEGLIPSVPGPGGRVVAV